ncbi:MAG: DUF1576 domain-containing protein [Spirochaetota bacterium]
MIGVPCAPRAPGKEPVLEIRESHLYWTISLLLVAAIVAGLAVQGTRDALAGVIAIQAHPARLLNDFTAVGGDGAALINAAIVALIGLALVALLRIRLSGPTIAAVFTMFGFGLFGKTPLNVIPIMIGVGISALIARKSLQEYILMALFGTALGPLATALAVETGLPVLPALALAAGGGFVVGILLPPLAISMLRLHQGFSLYNIGLTSGFIALFAASLMVASPAGFDSAAVVNQAPGLVLQLIAPLVSLVLILVAIIAGPRKATGDFLRLLELSGRLPSDFLTLVSPGAALLNAGLMGLVTWGYVIVVGGPLNGPVLGGIFTAIGFATFGKHPRNSIPVMAGAVIAIVLFGLDPAAPGPLLAVLFVLTIAPLAGEFGWGVGLIAGFLHLVLVQRTGAWHLGVNLYNNGFAGGLTATLIVAVIEWYRSTRPDRWRTGSADDVRAPGAKRSGRE